MNDQGQGIKSPGSIGLTSRPKQRYIDKVLMKQRDQMTDDANKEMEQQSQVSKFLQPGGASVMGPGPGTNLFGSGGSSMNRPSSLAMMLGGGS